MTLQKKMTTTKRATFSSVAVGLASVALVLTSCSGSGETSPSGTPSTVESTTPSPTPTPTPTPTPASADGPARNIPVPEIPEAATKETKEGLKAFVRHWFDLVSYAYATGDLEPVMSVTSEKCKTCGNIFGGIEMSYEDGGWMGGARLTVEDYEAEFQEIELPGAEPGYRSTILLSQNASTFYASDGSITDEGQETSEQLNIVFCSYLAGSWKLIDVGAPSVDADA